jgi:outer membrane protein assembly factor BamB
MPRPRPGLLHVGIKGHVLALDRHTGVEQWRTKLEGVRLRTHDFVHLHRDADNLYASYNGEIFCLDPKTGTVRWHNRLDRLGTGVTSLLSDAAPANGDAPLGLLEQERRARAARNSAAASSA